MGRKKIWTEDTIIEAFWAYEARTGLLPTFNACRTENGLPSGEAITRTFGSFSNAMIAAGYEARQQGSWNARDAETEVAMAAVVGGMSLTDVAGALDITGQALGRRIKRYREAMGLPPLALKPGRRSRVA